MEKVKPNDNGYYMPSEFAPHIGCLIIYPHNRSVFRNECEPARKAFRDVARAIVACGDPVTIFCHDEPTAAALRERISKEHNNDGLSQNANMDTCNIRVLLSDDSWCRDTGPTFLVHKKRRDALAGVDWGFNAYGGPDEGCYWPCDKDQALASGMIRTLSKDFKNITIECIPRHDIVLEGGSIHVDGEGTVLATEECLLNRNRNPQLTKKEIEEQVLAQLGAEKMIWLKRGLYMDEDTNGHIDNLACFAEPGHIVLSWSDDLDDPQHEISVEAMQILENATDARGRRIRVTTLNTPPPMFYTKGEVGSLAETADVLERMEGTRLAASYANFYIANHGVVVPGFGHEESDANAVKTLAALFPGRKVVQVPSREILLGGGNIHCITQQVPDPSAAS